MDLPVLGITTVSSNVNTATIDPDVWAQALAPYVNAAAGAISAVQIATFAPFSTPVAGNGLASFSAVGGLSISRPLAQGKKVLLLATGAVNQQYASGDISVITVWRKIGTGEWVDLTLSGCAGYISFRAPTADAMTPYCFPVFDTPALTQTDTVTYQIMAKSNNGDLWFGRRHDDTSSLNSATTLVLFELA